MDSNYDVIGLQPWMMKELNMDLTHACVYAIVHDYSMDHQGCYCGGIDYIADTLDIPHDVALECWENLEKVGLIRCVGEILPNQLGYEAFYERYMEE